MKINCYLIVSSSGVVTTRKTKPWLNSNELAIKLNVEIPNAFFERLLPVANIQIPEELVAKPDMETITWIAATEVADKLKLEVQEVNDGLVAMVKQHMEMEPNDER